MGKATAELRGEGYARFIAVAIAKNRTVQPLTPALPAHGFLRFCSVAAWEPVAVWRGILA